MNAAVFEGVGILNIKEVSSAQMEKSGDVLFRVETVSIWGTDTGGLSVPPRF